MHDYPIWAYVIPLAVGITLCAPWLAVAFLCGRIEQIMRKASTAEAYQLALSTLAETLRSRPPDNNGEMPRVVGDDYPHNNDDDDTVRLSRKLHLIYNMPGAHRSG